MRSTLTRLLHNPSAWQQIDRCLDDFFDLDPAARDDWLSRLATTQPDVAGSLQELLDKPDVLRGDTLLDTAGLHATALAALTHVSMVGQQFGGYTIERLIGDGGMGEVWLASRSDGQFEGRCAIKLLDRFAINPALAERVRHEGRVLARLGHPNIARLIDAGTTDRGRQFFILEYVDGERIDNYCQLRNLTTRARIRLFLDVVAAVAHAHSNLIVHRDLKPSNVLVTRDGVLKLLDFGIAKLLDPQPSLADASPRVEDAAMTPEYAAPEQLTGQTCSTAADIYQLGMLLYVLLTGIHPLRASGTRAERIKAALEGHVSLASTLARGALRRELRGDLDAILVTALHVDPAQRYPTAEAFRQELLRFLNLEPVTARRGSPFYHVWKFVGRHRWAVAASAAAVVSLAATAVFALAQARAATVERDRAIGLASRNEAVTEFQGMLITEAAEAATPITVNDLLARSEQLARADTGGNRENRAAVLAMIAAHYGTLGEHAKSAHLLETARELLAQSHDHDLQSGLTCLYAQALASLGQAEAADRTIATALKEFGPDTSSSWSCLLARSHIAARNNDAPNALRHAKEALARYRVGEQSTATEAMILAAIASAYYLNGQNSEADGYYRLALQRHAELGRERGPEAVNLRNNWAVVTDAAGMPRRSLELYDETIALVTQRRPGSDPPAYLIGNRGRALEALGRYAEARTAYDRELDLAVKQGNPVGQAHALLGMASIAQLSNDPAGARGYVARLAAVLRGLAPPGAPPWMASTVVEGRIALAEGDLHAAREHFAAALRAGMTNGIGIAAALGQAEVDLDAGAGRQAAAEARNALAAATVLQGGLPYSNQSGLASLLLGRALLMMGDRVAAREAIAVAVRNLASTVDEDHPSLIQARALSAMD